METTGIVQQLLPVQERIDDTDRAYLSSALARRDEANIIVQFIQSELAVRYRLGEGDQVTPDGIIIRKAKNA